MFKSLPQVPLGASIADSVRKTEKIAKNDALFYLVK